MINKFRVSIMLIMIVFSMVLAIFISYVNNNALKERLLHENETKLELIQENILTSLKDVDKAYYIFDGQVANEMKNYSDMLLEKYKENPNFNEWNYQEIKQSIGMDVYILDETNTIINSSFTKDIGLNFSECCEEFSKLLDERRDSGKFYHDGLDLQQKTGELKKFSYVSTHDNKYLIELGFSLKDGIVFKNFNFLDVAADFKKRYYVIENITVFNKEGFVFGEGNESNIIPENRKKYFKMASEFNVISEIKDKFKGNNVTYRYIPYSSNIERGISNDRVVEIVYNDEEINKLIEDNKNQFMLQVIFILFFAIVVASVISKLVAKPIYLAFHDNLTGLKNRAYFENTLKLYISKNKKVGLLVFDLDNFKKVNDKLGHDRGDVLLKYVGNTIKSSVGDDGIAARLGGDEFVVILNNIKDKNDLEKMASKVINNLKSPIDDDNKIEEKIKQGKDIMRIINVTTSIGGAIYPENAEDMDSLYKKADIALYYAKENGKNSYVFYGDIEEYRVNEN